MATPETLLQQFTELYEKQDILIKNITKPVMSEYHISESHTISWIGRLENPNVTKLAQNMNMTKGAVSKIIKKLQAKGDVTSYQSDTNKKEIYYTLTEKGQEVYEAHQERHQQSDNRDLQFFRGVPEEEAAFISSFLTRFNTYLDTLIDQTKK